jgi:alanyl-tRNA synthetase
MKDIYPGLETNQKLVLDNLKKEENQFEKTLDKGLKELEKLIKIGKDKTHNSVAIRLSPEKKPKPSQYAINAITPKDAFKLYSTYGFPLEMINQELAKHLLYIDKKEFHEEFKKHKELSRTASAGKFKGGLADHSEIVTKYHTATHLLHEALRKVLGCHVEQRGSNLNAERLRFDFSHPEKMTDEEIKKVENLVNEQIQAKLEIACEEKSVDEAKKEGAIGLFGDKYGAKVKVYSISNFSKEICGGPHVNNTSELGKFKITKEQSASAGVRRIKATLE